MSVVPADNHRPCDRGLPLSEVVVAGFRGMKWALKWTGIALGLMVVALPAATSRLEAWLSDREELFLLWGQVFALVPGLPGKYLRKCYYSLTLRAFSLSSEIGFLSGFNHREAEVGRRVYVGPGASIGIASLGDGVQIGTRTSILSGGHQHRMGADGCLTACGRESLQRVRIGEETWIGEAAVIMADVGSRCIVAAAGVVSCPVPDGCLVGGNPARFIQRVTEGTTGAPA
jgi:acetyltransferase-like isoleucine patch superfamily enzyme